MSGFGFNPAPNPIITSAAWKPKQAQIAVPFDTAFAGGTLSNGGYTLDMPALAAGIYAQTDTNFVQGAVPRGDYFTLDKSQFADGDQLLLAWLDGVFPTITAGAGVSFTYDAAEDNFRVGGGSVLAGPPPDFGLMVPAYNGEQMCVAIDTTGFVKLFRGTNPAAAAEFNMTSGVTSGLTTLAAGAGLSGPNGNATTISLLSSPPVEYDGVLLHSIDGGGEPTNLPNPRMGRAYEIAGLAAPITVPSIGLLSNGDFVYFSRFTGELVGKTLAGDVPVPEAINVTDVDLIDTNSQIKKTLVTTLVETTDPTNYFEIWSNFKVQNASGVHTSLGMDLGEISYFLAGVPDQVGIPYIGKVYDKDDATPGGIMQFGNTAYDTANLQVDVEKSAFMTMFLNFLQFTAGTINLESWGAMLMRVTGPTGGMVISAPDVIQITSDNDINLSPGQTFEVKTFNAPTSNFGVGNRNYNDNRYIARQVLTTGISGSQLAANGDHIVARSEGGLSSDVQLTNAVSDGDTVRVSAISLDGTASRVLALGGGGVTVQNPVTGAFAVSYSMPARTYSTFTFQAADNAWFVSGGQ